MEPNNNSNGLSRFKYEYVDSSYDPRKRSRGSLSVSGLGICESESTANYSNMGATLANGNNANENMNGNANYSNTNTNNSNNNNNNNIIGKSKLSFPLSDGTIQEKLSESGVENNNYNISDDKNNENNKLRKFYFSNSHSNDPITSTGHFRYGGVNQSNSSDSDSSYSSPEKSPLIYNSRPTTPDIPPLSLGFSSRATNSFSDRMLSAPSTPNMSFINKLSSNVFDTNGNKSLKQDVSINQKYDNSSIQNSNINTENNTSNASTPKFNIIRPDSSEIKNFNNTASSSNNSSPSSFNNNSFLWSWPREPRKQYKEDAFSPNSRRSSTSSHNGSTSNVNTNANTNGNINSGLKFFHRGNSNTPSPKMSPAQEISSPFINSFNNPSNNGNISCESMSPTSLPPISSQMDEEYNESFKKNENLVEPRRVVFNRTRRSLKPRTKSLLRITHELQKESFPFDYEMKQEAAAVTALYNNLDSEFLDSNLSRSLFNSTTISTDTSTSKNMLMESKNKNKIASNSEGINNIHEKTFNLENNDNIINIEKINDDINTNNVKNNLKSKNFNVDGNDSIFSPQHPGLSKRKFSGDISCDLIDEDSIKYSPSSTASISSSDNNNNGKVKRKNSVGYFDYEFATPQPVAFKRRAVSPSPSSMIANGSSPGLVASRTPKQFYEANDIMERMHIN